VLGDINLDIIAFHTSFPTEGGEDIAEKAIIRHGGSGANIAHTLSLLGVSTLMIGCVGRDPVGAALTEGLAAVHVDVSHIQQTEMEPSGVVYVVVTESGERTMLTYRGANKYLRHSILKTEFLDTISLLHISGYSLLEGEQKNTAFKLLKKRGDYLVTIDMCIPLAKSPAILDRLTSRLDYLFINTHEFKELSQHSRVKTLSELASRLGCMVVLKKGAGGCEITSISGDVLKIPAVPVKAVDTTGAGDAFAAGFIYELIRGSPPLKCGETAVKLGALASTTVGGRIESLDIQ
jgi:ribokinase